MYWGQIALEGVEKEAEVGARTVLDVLDAQQELRDSQVSLVRAHRNQVVAAFQLDAAAGELTARQLDLPVGHRLPDRQARIVVYYNVNQHYQEVHDEWVGGSSSGDVSRDFDNRPARTSPLRRRGLDGSARPDEYGSNPSR